MKCRMVGSRHHVWMTDLAAYKRTVDRRHAFLDECAAEAQEQGPYDDPPTQFERLRRITAGTRYGRWWTPTSLVR